MSKLSTTVKWFDAKKGYGFLDHPEGEDDVFVHYSQIESEQDFKTLRTGQQVEFEMNDGPKGLHALEVIPLAEQDDAAQDGAAPNDATQGDTSNGLPSADAATPPAHHQSESTSYEGASYESEGDSQHAWADEEASEESFSHEEPSHEEPVSETSSFGVSDAHHAEDTDTPPASSSTPDEEASPASGTEPSSEPFSDRA